MLHDNVREPRDGVPVSPQNICKTMQDISATVFGEKGSKGLRHRNSHHTCSPCYNHQTHHHHTEGNNGRGSGSWPPLSQKKQEAEK